MATKREVAPENRLTLTLAQEEDFRFRAELGSGHAIVMDEPPPLGAGAGPSPAAMLAAAVGDCLSASLLLCLRKARIPVEGFRTEVDLDMGRNADGRLRIDEIRVALAPGVAEADRERMERCLGVFEDYCIVTESVRRGIDVLVEVRAPEPDSSSSRTEETASAVG